MKNYVLGDKYKMALSSSSVGMQIKCERNGYYYKLNTAGNEGLVEYLVTLVLKHSTIKNYVSYEYCTVNRKLACRSKDFTCGGIFVTADNLNEMVTGNINLTNTLASYRDAVSRYNYLLELFRCIGLYAEIYLKTMLYLDMLILNTDRHTRNYGVLLSSGRYSFAPIFDNGLSLRTVPDRNCSSTICGNFEAQVIATGYPLKSPFKINYKTLSTELSRLNPSIKQSYEYKVLCEQLNRYRSVFSM